MEVSVVSCTYGLKNSLQSYIFSRINIREEYMFYNIEFLFPLLIY